MSSKRNLNDKLKYEDEEVSLLNNNKEEEPKVSTLDKTEPQSHQKGIKKSWRVIFPCWSVEDGYSLSKNEIEAFRSLERKTQEPYERSNAKHEEKLGELFKECLKKEGNEIQADLKSEAWKDLGFQGEDPRTDFRGGGFMGLKQLFKFSIYHRDKLEEMKAETANGRYILAVVSIGVTFYLKSYFHMNQNTELLRKENKLATRRALKSFCRMLSQGGNLFQRLHDLFMIKTFDVWIAACRANDKLTIMDYGEAEKKVKAAFQGLLDKDSFMNVSEFTRAFEAVKIEPHEITKFTF
jgi:hypothetical protein